MFVYLLFVVITVATPPDTLPLTVTIRDFKNWGLSSQGHPDFDHYTSNIPTAGLVNPTLGYDRKPVFLSSGSPVVITSAETFGQWFNDVQDVNMRIDSTIVATYSSGSYNYTNKAFFPIDNKGWGNEGTETDHNFGFTLELHTTFTHVAGLNWAFEGDDDLWLFINNKLVVDLGGVHPPTSSNLNLDTLDLVPGQTYSFDLFFAERHEVSSSLCFTTNIPLNPCGTVDTDGDSVGDQCDYCKFDPIVSLQPPSGWSCHFPIPVGWYSEGPAIAKLSATTGIIFVRGVGTIPYLNYRTFVGYPSLRITPADYWQNHEISWAMNSRPSVASNSSHVFVVSLGTDNRIYIKTFSVSSTTVAVTVNSISPWTSIGGIGTGAPVVTLTSDGRIDVLVPGADHKLWRRYSTNGGTTWNPSSAWEGPIGGLVLASDITANVVAGITLNVFVKGNDGGEYQTFKWTQTTNWLNWTRNSDYKLVNMPHVTTQSWIENTDDFIENHPDGVRHWAWNRVAGFTKQVTIGGVYKYEPTILGMGVGELLVAGVWKDGNLYYRYYHGPATGDYFQDEAGESHRQTPWYFNSSLVIGVSVGAVVCALIIVAIVVVLVIIRLKIKKYEIVDNTLKETLT